LFLVLAALVAFVVIPTFALIPAFALIPFPIAATPRAVPPAHTSQ
jgi:hypothetical protein